MADPKKTRASGDTVTEEVMKEVSKEIDQPIDGEMLPEETKKTFRTPGFSRMRTDWTSDDKPIIERAKASVEGRILNDFADAYQVMFEVYNLVREPRLDSSGRVMKDQYGMTLWKKSESGSYEEDWTKLSSKQKENLLFTITTRLFEWSQRNADAWAESMFAKAQWEERFSIGFDAPLTGTVDDRKAHGNLDSRDERYFAIFLTTYSKKSEAIVRTMELLGQRLKDSMV